MAGSGRRPRVPQEAGWASLLAARTDAVGWLGGGIVVSGLTVHVWSNAILARSERQASTAGAPVAEGLFRFVRNPIYLAGITLLLGVGLLYPSWRAMDFVLPLTLFLYFHWAVVQVEEPELRRRFGATYDEYSQRVPRWFPVPTTARVAQHGKTTGGAKRHG